MASILFNYKENKKEYIAILNDGNTRKIAEKDNIINVLKVLYNEDIKRIIVDNNYLIINYSFGDIIIEKPDIFLQEPNYQFFIDKITRFSVVDNILSREKARIINKKNKFLDDDLEHERVLHIIRAATITGVLISSILVIAPIYNAIHKDEHIKKEYDKETIIPTENIYANLDKDAVIEKISLNFPNTSDENVKQTMLTNYRKITNDLSKNYGIDSKLLLALIGPNADKGMTYTDSEGRFGLMQIDYNSYVNDGVAAYNYKKNEYELIGITPSDLSDVELYLKISSMIYQENLRNCNYNFIAAIQSMHENKDYFREIIIKYSKSLYGEVPPGTKNPDDYYYYLVINNLYDYGWLDLFTDDNGKIYAYEVLSYLPSDTIVEFHTIEDDNSNQKIYFEVINQRMIKTNTK